MNDHTSLSRQPIGLFFFLILLLIFLLSPPAKAQIMANSGGPYSIDEGSTLSLFGTAEINEARIRRISLALHDFHATYKKLPAAYLTSPDGTPLLSWRVIILPFLNRVDLYNQFDLTKPWDDPVNLALLDQMPDVFRRLGAAENATNTAFAGAFRPGDLPDSQQKGTLMEGGQDEPETTFGGSDLRFRDVTDGLSNTLHFGELNDRDIPWTAPDDVEILTSPNLGNPAGFSGSADNSVIMAFVDGSVRFIKTNIPQSITDAMYTRANGEVLPDLSPYTMQAGTIEEASFSWDLDNDGTFETNGSGPSFDATGLAAGEYPISLQVTTTTGVTITVSTSVTVNAVPNGDADGDGITDDLDFCPDTEIPEATVPVIRLKPHRFALMNEDDRFEGRAFGFTFDLDDTGGCSCEQIIDELNLSENNQKFGCRLFPMIVWAINVYFNSPQQKNLSGEEGKEDQIDWDKFLSVEANALGVNYPNPASQMTVVPFSILTEGTTSLQVYDALGRLVSTPIDQERLPAGNYEVEVAVSQLAAGTYYYRLSSGNFTAIKPMQVVH